MSLQPGILARGPWTPSQVAYRWGEEFFDPGPALTSEADAAIEALRERGSPSHDGVSGRLAGFSHSAAGLELEIQPVRWSLRLLDGACQSMAALCVTRDAQGRWLAGRRAPWLASWAGRWALGAGGAVDLAESPVHTLTRELDEEWGVAPESLSIEALVCLPTGLVLLVGQARLAEGVEVVREDEHDAHAWWPAEIADWPEEADEPLRRMASLLIASGGK
ncbi:MAG: NUDIX domain-containing protein [Actinomycetota bacterium]